MLGFFRDLFLISRFRNKQLSLSLIRIFVALFAMQAARVSPAEEVDYWLELKSQWEEWRTSGGRFSLGDEARRYFERLVGRYFNGCLTSDGKVAHLGYRLDDDQEAWSYVFAYLFTTRAKETGAHLLDDIFERSLQKAAAKGVGGSLASVLGFIKNQFKMRVRNAVREWVREEAGTEGQRDHKEGMDAPLISGEGGDERTRHDVLTGEEAMGAEERELVEMGQKIGERQFEAMDGDSRICTYLKSLKVSLANPKLVAFLGKNKSVLYEVEKGVRRDLVLACREPGGDGEGCYMIATAAFQYLQDECRLWFFTEKANEPLFSMVKEKAPHEIVESF